MDRRPGDQQASVCIEVSRPTGPSARKKVNIFFFRTHIGRARAWLRLALMQKKLEDYFRWVSLSRANCLRWIYVYWDKKQTVLDVSSQTNCFRWAYSVYLEKHTILSECTVHSDKYTVLAVSMNSDKQKNSIFVSLNIHSDNQHGLDEPISDKNTIWDEYIDKHTMLGASLFI